MHKYLEATDCIGQRAGAINKGLKRTEVDVIGSAHPFSGASFAATSALTGQRSPEGQPAIYIRTPSIVQHHIYWTASAREAKGHNGAATISICAAIQPACVRKERRTDFPRWRHQATRDGSRTLDIYLSYARTHARTHAHGRQRLQLAG